MCTYTHIVVYVYTHLLYTLKHTHALARILIIHNTHTTHTHTHTHTISYLNAHVLKRASFTAHLLDTFKDRQVFCGHVGLLHSHTVQELQAHDNNIHELVCAFIVRKHHVHVSLYVCLSFCMSVRHYSDHVLLLKMAKYLY